MQVDDLEIEHYEDEQSEKLVAKASINSIDYTFHYFRQKGSDSRFRDLGSGRSVFEIDTESEDRIQKAVEERLVSNGYPIQPKFSDIDSSKHGTLFIYTGSHIQENRFNSSSRTLHIYRGDTPPPKTEDVNDDDIVIKVIDDNSVQIKISVEYGNDEPEEWVIKTAVRKTYPKGSTFDKIANPEIIKWDSRTS